MTAFKSVKDSGEREGFATGSRRDTRKGKGRFDLISPIGLTRLAAHYENGAAKYGDRNWEKGQPCSRYLDSGMRHFVAVLRGDQDEDHPAAVVWNMFGYMHTEQLAMDGDLPAELLDLPWHEDARAELEAVAELLDVWHDRAAREAAKEEAEALNAFCGADWHAAADREVVNPPTQGTGEGEAA